MTPVADWTLWRSFLAVLDAGSLSGAATTLALSQPTLGRHVETLEAALGGALFVRSPKGLAPTDLARALRAHAQAMSAAAAALERAAASAASDEGGVVRVTASHVVGAEVLPPILTAFREAHPGVVIELVLSNRNDDLLTREADIAVRMIRPRQGALTARRIGTVALGLFAHRRYVERHGVPDSLEALTTHPMIGFDREAPVLPGGLEGTHLAFERGMFALRTDSDLAGLAMLRAGFGIGVCQCALAAQDPDLVPLLPGVVRFAIEMWLAMHEDLKTSRPVRRLYDHLAAGLSAYVRGQQ